MATVLRELIGDRDHRNIRLLCGVSIRLETFLSGDPARDRIVFEPPLFETICETRPAVLRYHYLTKVTQVALTLSEEDVLVLILAGHGELGGVFKIGEAENICELTKDELEASLGNTKATVWLISTACYSETWESPKWTLLAAAQADEEAPSLAAVSALEKVRGGFFVNALVAQHVNEFKLIAPCPASVDDNGNRGQQQHPHDFGPGKSVQPSRSTPKRKRNLDEVRDWIPPSTAGCETPSSSANMPVKPVVLSIPDSSGSIEPTRRLSTEDDKLLISLAQDLLKFKPIQTARETPTIVMCYRVIRGRNPLNDTEKARLLSVLKTRKQYQELAVAIAKSLQWDKFVDELGRPDGEEQAQLSAMFGLQQKAEASGCLVTILIQRHSLGRYSGAAGWLARIWEAAGSPSIESRDWKLAVEQSRRRITNLDQNSSILVD